MFPFELLSKTYSRIFPKIKFLRGSMGLRIFIYQLAAKGKEIKEKPTNIFEKEWDILIVLDACRHDLLEEVMERKLPYIISVGSWTMEWVKNTFYRKKFYDLIYVSGNPYISDYMLRKLFGRNPFYHLESVWLYGWDKKLKTVPPKIVRKTAIKLHKKYPHRKMIVHFMQPHHPFIGRKRIVAEGIEDSFLRFSKGKAKICRTVWDLFMEGKISKEEFWEAYKSNLEIVLKEVRKMSNKVKEKKIVLTSDHGNALGEYGIYEHHPNIRIEELVKVPCVYLEKVDL